MACAARFSRGSRKTQLPRLALLVSVTVLSAFRLQSFPSFSYIVDKALTRVQLKEQLHRAPDKALVAELEKNWRPAEAVSSTRQLQGTWKLLSPTETRSRGAISGDLPRMLLNLYTGNIGKMLSMQLVSAPTLRIDKDGRTTTETELRWGSQTDKIIMHSQLQVSGQNLLQEKPKAVYSSALKLTFPAFQRERKSRISYFDDELLILRDARGIVDILSRVEELPSQPPVETVQNDQQPEATNQDGKVGETKDVLVKVQTITESLEALQVQSQQDKKARGVLSKELERLEKALGAAAVDSHADSVKLSTLDKLSAGTLAASEAQGLMSSQKIQERDTLNTEIAQLQTHRDQLERNLNSYRHQESSLRNQIAVLQTELNTGPRDAWPAYRAAIGKARQELADVKGQLKSSAQDVSKLQRELSLKGVQLEQLKRSADSELEIRQKLETELEEQKREYHQATKSLSEAAQVEEALRNELASVRQQLAVLEKREIHGKEMASEMQNEIKTLAQQVKTASKAVKALTNSNGNKRSFWPLR
eukprot:TRINITY_DN72451_c0_g1_i1.p1 TRINITY_DN72451_c0_g1~~TRINITY_DN72451_c0_g1_i1.p1  ORF type:complete len:549 (+),score=103.18 TRINITY_DN72451_c0_g1_i1:46-1647(+)